MTKQKSVFWDWIETIAIAVILALVIRTFLFQPFYIPSGSMEPTLQVGDKIIVNKLTSRFKDPERGQIVVFKFPYDPSQDFVKRIIGLPGETVEIRDSRVFINGQALAEDYLPEGLVYPDFPPVTVPANSYFVLGDNRNNSQDSRVWGPLPRDLLIGNVLAIYWPLERIGTVK
ncbi:MAG TPA: signal peptidase I [Clostridia bacterium]|nr:signal peptidase I [Clostridia bacterium]